MRRTNFFMACTLAALSWGLSGTASAQVASSPDQPATRDVYFTFSQPVMVPNQTLPAGKYLFRVTGQGRNIVEIYSGDKSRMIQRAMVVHAARSDSPERAEIGSLKGPRPLPWLSAPGGTRRSDRDGNSFTHATRRSSLPRPPVSQF